jgi:hypothetical protein
MLASREQPSLMLVPAVMNLLVKSSGAASCRSR